MYVATRSPPHRSELVRFAERLVGTDRAEDVVQQALLKAWLVLSQSSQVAGPRAWLRRIVHTTGLNALRERGRDRRRGGRPRAGD